MTAELNGLDPKTIKVGCCDKTAKIKIVASAMGDTFAHLTDRKLMKKSVTRWIAEHSIQAAMSYTMTCLSTHWMSGKMTPEMMKRLNVDVSKLSDHVKETMETMKEVLGSDCVCPVDPNLVFSTDDTTKLCFEGTRVALVNGPGSSLTKIRSHR